MKKLFLWVSILSFALMTSHSVYAGGPDGCSPACKKTCPISATAASTDDESDLPEFANVYATAEEGSEYALCPVSGTSFKVSENSPFSKVDGKGYYHCCAGCKKPFEANPKKYLDGMKKKMAEAKERFEKGERPEKADM